MKKELFAICDVKTGSFYPPMVFVNRNDCMRAMHDDLAARDTVLSRHPEDFNVQYVGNWDEDRGLIIGNDVPLFAFSLSEVCGKQVKNADK